MPKLDSEREANGNQIGADGESLLKRIYAPNAPEWLRLIPAVEILRQVWVQQFYAPVKGQVKLRTAKRIGREIAKRYAPFNHSDSFPL